MKTKVKKYEYLNILCVEDSPKDAEIMRESLIDAGYTLKMDITAVEKEFVSLLRSRKYDIILSDFKLPGFDGFTTLRWAMEICPDVPFICISGTVGEEIAVDLLKHGAIDYILKDRLEKLPFVIKRVLDDVKERKARKQAEEALSNSELRYRRLFESAKDGILILDAESGMITDVNPFLVELLGYSTEQFHGKKIWEIGIFKDIIANKEKFLELQQKEFVRYDDLPLKTNDGRQIAVEFVSNVYIVDHHKVIQCNIRDITERKHAEGTILKERALLRTIIDNLPVGVFVKDKEYKKIIANPTHIKEVAGHLKYLGMNSEIDILGKTDFDIFPKKLAEEFFNDDQKVIKDGSALMNIEGIGFNEKAAQLNILVSKIPLRENNGQIIGMVGVATDITERKLAEEILQESEKKYRQLFDASPDGIIVIGPDERIVSANIAMARMYKYNSPEDLIGVHPPQFVAPSSRAFSEQVLRRRLNGEDIGTVEYELVRKDGTNFYGETLATILRNEEGEITGYICITRDTTEHKLAQEAIKKSEERFRSLYNNSTIGLYRTTPDGKIILANPSLVKMLGYSAFEELASRNLEHEGFEPSYERKQFITEIEKNGEVLGLEEAWNRKDGSIVYVRESARVIRDSSGKTLYYDGNVEDITERKIAEEKLKFSNAILSTQQDVSIDGILVINDQGRIISFNKQFVKIWNIPKNVLESKSDKQALQYVIEMLVNPEEFLTRVNYLYEHRNEISNEEIVLKDGRIFDRYSAPMFGKDSKYYGRVWYFRDITERKQAEEALAGERFLLTSLIDTIPDNIYFKDRDSRFIRINNTMAKKFGLNYPNEAVGKTDFDFFNLAHAKPAFEAEQQILATSESIIGLEEKEVWPDGHITWVSTTKLPLWGKAGKIIGIMGISRDISESKHAADELQRQKTEIEKQASEYLALNDEYQSVNKELRSSNDELKEARDKAQESDRLKTAFLQNMSHEIRTPMNGILGFAELLKSPNLSDEKTKSFIKIIQQSGQRMLNIIGDIVNISKIETGQIEIDLNETDVNGLLKQLYSFFSIEAEKKGLILTLKPGFSDESCKIETDESKLTQVLSNVINNALKFTKTGAIDFGYQRKEKMIEFYVKDTGIGIAPENQEIIFERFRQVDMADARNYEGAGLGLAISKAFVEKLGGKIWVQSELEKGATFFFNIPYNPKIKIKLEKPLEVGNEAKLPGINILIVEDDNVCMELLKFVLEEEKANLFFASDGQEAFYLVKTTPELQIVLMDLKMPVMNGFEATKLIKKLKPDLPVIAQSAYAFSNDQDKAKMAGCDDFISKPIVRELLLAKINKQLAKRG